MTNNDCYQFSWSTKFNFERSIDIKITNYEVQNFTDLFDIVSESFPGIFTSDMKHIITYKKYLNEYIF